MVGNIGANAPIGTISFHGAGPITIPNNARASIFDVANNTAVVTANYNVTGDQIFFTFGGTFNLNNGGTINVDFNGKDANLKLLVPGQVLTGGIDNKGIADNGIINW
ncbi:MAG: hypothetical protein RCG15_03015 [Candidatus Rickettsia vulgarisii]